MKSIRNWAHGFGGMRDHVARLIFLLIAQNGECGDGRHELVIAKVSKPEIVESGTEWEARANPGRNCGLREMQILASS